MASGACVEELMRILIEEITSCTRCPLHKARKNPVPGEGCPEAELMLVGEAPGRWEDEKGRPFVGAAGKLLNSLLASIGLRREDVYIANVLKCRPPGNRDPRPEEVEACAPFLDRQITMVRPSVIATLGKHSTNYVFSKAGVPFERVSDVRGRVFEVRILGLDVSVVPTYHPALALYNPKAEGVLRSDFELIGRVVRGVLEEREEPLEREGRRRTLEDFMG